MQVVIPYKLDRQNGTELRYAIRSMIKHFKPFTDVLLIGDKPNWYKGRHIEAVDTYKRKEYSIYRKLKMADALVLYSNDDFYALKDFDENLPNYYQGICKDHIAGDMTYRNLYKACPPNWLDFDCHAPMIIDTRIFTWPHVDRPIKSTYANVHHHQEEEYFLDLKIRDPLTKEDTLKKLEGRSFFSTASPYKGVVEALEELYPVPSDYEAK